jgi:hypothetical protein
VDRPGDPECSLLHAQPIAADELADNLVQPGVLVAGERLLHDDPQWRAFEERDARLRPANIAGHDHSLTSNDDMPGCASPSSERHAELQCQDHCIAELVRRSRVDDPLDVGLQVEPR